MPPTSMIEHDEFWQQFAKVAMGLQNDDPINWPHYAEEARRVVDERDRYREALESAWTYAHGDHRAIVGRDKCRMHPCPLIRDTLGKL